MIKISLRAPFFRVTKGDHTKPIHRELHPTREWLLGLLICLVVIGVGVAQSSHQFLYYKGVDAQGGVFEGNVPTYNQAIVSRALDLFALRKKTYTALQENTVQVTPLPIATSTESDVVSEPINESTTDTMQASTTARSEDSVIAN